MKTFVLWLFVVTGPNGVQVEWSQHTTKEKCQAVLDKHSLMGLGEYRAECRKRHKTIWEKE